MQKLESILIEFQKEKYHSFPFPFHFHPDKSKYRKLILFWGEERLKIFDRKISPSPLSQKRILKRKRLKLKFRLQEFHAKITATRRAIRRELERDDRGPISGHWRRKSRSEEGRGWKMETRTRRVSRLVRRLAPRNRVFGRILWRGGGEKLAMLGGGEKRCTPFAKRSERLALIQIYCRLRAGAGRF